MCFHILSLLKLTRPREDHVSQRESWENNKNMSNLMKSALGPVFCLLRDNPHHLPHLSPAEGQDVTPLCSPTGSCVDTHSYRERGTNNQPPPPSPRGPPWKGPTSPGFTRTRSSQMPWTQRALEPPSQSSYLDAHWGPWVSAEQRQLLVTQSTIQELFLSIS